MNHSIKLHRAAKAANYLPMATAHILRNVPDSAIEKLTGAEIAELMQAFNTHYWEGKAEAEREITEYIPLPSGVDIWAVIGDKNYLGYKEFADGLHIPDILEARGQQVAKWRAESNK